MNAGISAPRVQNEDNARECPERIRWGGTPFCPPCDFRYNTCNDSDAERANQALAGISAIASPIGGLVRSPPKYFEPPRQIGERRKRWSFS
jgi:hypothetical protein